ncbi:YgdI/YgdR family lipoprotein [Kistimonas asteriae]|uniref:YgdI/YgdR family lipoprotein n=1 Tax=Kistimonas asteriae TaxID=517724 RepID=UPI001BA4CAF3|nr:YgdI/YgdR family lipoprotein [Kistimonas asteriae]
MNKTITALLLSTSLVVLAGCATPSAVHLNDGTRIDAVDTPSYDDDSGFYTIETVDGKERQINKAVIQSIEALE